MTHDALKRGDLVELVDGKDGMDKGVGWVGVVLACGEYAEIRWIWGNPHNNGGFWPWRFRKIGEADLAD